jgi:hypothetical protein
MLIDTDLLFDELVGYEFYHKSEVKAVIDEKVKCDDGEVLEFYESVEYIIEEYDDLIIMKRKQTIQELIEFKEYLNEKSDLELIESVDTQIKEAQQNGAYEAFACLHNDTIYDLYSFSL